MRTRESRRASLRMQSMVEQCPNGEDATARRCPGFQNDDRHAGLVKKISGSQACETGADDHNGGVGIERMRGNASNRCRERKRSRGLLKKSSVIHILLFVGPDAARWDRGIMAREIGTCQGG